MDFPVEVRIIGGVPTLVAQCNQISDSPLKKGDEVTIGEDSTVHKTRPELNEHAQGRSLQSSSSVGEVVRVEFLFPQVRVEMKHCAVGYCR